MFILPEIGRPKQLFDFIGRVLRTSLKLPGYICCSCGVYSPSESGNGASPGFQSRDGSRTLGNPFLGLVLLEIFRLKSPISHSFTAAQLFKNRNVRSPRPPKSSPLERISSLREYRGRTERRERLFLDRDFPPRIEGEKRENKDDEKEGKKGA